MAYRGQYDEYVQKMLDDARAVSETIEGPVNPRIGRASEDSVMNYAAWADPWNPLFNDREYGKTTRYGDALAAPGYQDCITSFFYFPEIDPRGGYTGFHYHHFVGEDWENLRPMRVDDTVTLWRKPLEIRDITIDGPDTLHDFFCVFNHADVVTPSGEVVATVRGMADISVHPNLPEPPGIVEPFKDHVYTPEELAFLDAVIKSEAIRGAKARYWEDVNLGDNLQPVSIGPTTRWDMVAFVAAHQELPFFPMRRLRELGGPTVVDPKTNVTHLPLEWHVSKDAAALNGEPNSFNFGASSRAQMTRLVTNWIGDDGEVRALKWRHYTKTYTGDSTIGRGRVVGKRIEGGEYLVDIDVWMENLCRGNVSESALITVCLPSNGSESTERFASTHSGMRLTHGDKVRFKVRHDCFPTGYPLDNAEGVAAELFPWQRCVAVNGPYVSIKLTKGADSIGVGKTAASEANIFVFRAENLEKLT